MDDIAKRMRVRAIVVLALMFAVVLQLGYLFAYLAGSQAGMTAVLVGAGIAVIADVYAYYASDSIALRSGARLVTPYEQPALHRVVDDMVIATGLPRPKVAVIDDLALNAFATGRDPEHSLVAVTTGLLSRLNSNELRAVVAHEFGHIYNRDIMVSAVASMAVRTVAIPATIMVFTGGAMLTFSSPGRKTKEQQQAENGTRMAGLGIMMIGLLVGITLVPALKLLNMSLGRSRERLADMAAVKFTRDPESLSAALTKLGQDEVPSALAASPAAALCMVRPSGFGGIAGWWQNMMSTHPSIESRVRDVQAIARGRSIDLVEETKAGANAGMGVMIALTAALIAVPGVALANRGDCGALTSTCGDSYSSYSNYEPAPDPTDFDPAPEYTDPIDPGLDDQIVHTHTVTTEPIDPGLDDQVVHTHTVTAK